MEWSRTHPELDDRPKSTKLPTPEERAFRDLTDDHEETEFYTAEERAAMFTSEPIEDAKVAAWNATPTIGNSDPLIPYNPDPMPDYIVARAQETEGL
jgi:hypothetical protein